MIPETWLGNTGTSVVDRTVCVGHSEVLFSNEVACWGSRKQRVSGMVALAKAFRRCPLTTTCRLWASLSPRHMAEESELGWIGLRSSLDFGEPLETASLLVVIVGGEVGETCCALVYNFDWTLEGSLVGEAPRGGSVAAFAYAQQNIRSKYFKPNQLIVLGS